MSGADADQTSDLGRRLARMNRRMEEQGVDWEPTETPSADVVESDDAFVVTVDLPGFDPDGVNLLVSRDLLYVKARRDPDTSTDAGTFVERERRRERVARTVALPEPVDEERVRAALRDGVLTVTLPKGGDADAAGDSTWIPVTRPERGV